MFFLILQTQIDFYKINQLDNFLTLKTEIDFLQN